MRVTVIGNIDALDNQEKRKLAEDSSTSKELLYQLSKDKIRFVREEVAKNPNTPKDILYHLSYEKDKCIREAVAQNWSAPEEAFYVLSTYEDVRELVVCNPSCPEQILSHFINYDNDEKITRTIAKNSHCPKNILRELAKNEDERVRKYVAQNPNTPAEVLINFEHDTDEWVRKSARENLDKRPEEEKEAITIRSHHIAHAEPIKEKKLTPKQDAELVRKAVSSVSNRRRPFY